MSRFDAKFSTDASRETVVIPVDFRAATLLEESQNNGYTRVTKPVGAPTMPLAENQTSGGRGLTDTEAAFRLGANGRSN